MEQQQQTKGNGKESQLSKIAAAVNPGSMAEANPTATQSMISTFMQTFESSALELREETNDDQKINGFFSESACGLTRYYRIQS